MTRRGSGKPRRVVAFGLVAGVIVGCLAVAAARAHSTPSASAPCAWAGESDQRDVNVGAPDLDAYYVADELAVSTSERVEIHGEYPFARYFSFHVYDDRTLLPVGTLYDQQINPDRGSSNPFRGPVKAGSGDSYTLSIVFGAAPKHPAANTIFVDPRGIGPTATLVYRIYVPTDPTQPGGGVVYPSVTIQSGDGGVTYVSEPGCATTPPPGGSAVYRAAANSDYPSFLPSQHVSGASPIPIWQRSFGSRLGNEQNAYLSTTISRQYGQLVVIHARAATFPNNRAGEPIYGRHQLRYWSFCTYDAQGEAGYGCAADYAATIRHGYVTYVVSDPGSRPANATARNGVTWLPWGGDQYSASIVERNMLPGAGFGDAIQAVTQTGRDSNAHRVMGSYYPAAVYCSEAVFERGGWRACFRARLSG
jgi:hypothetical protein